MNSTIPEIDGTWTDPLDDFEIVQVAATREFALVAGRVGLRPEIRSIHWENGTLRLAPFHPVPPPSWKGERWDELEDMGEVEPWLSIDDSTAPPQLAVTRVEYQGGSWGVVVYPDIKSPAHEEIESPTGEADIAFGVPLVLRGDEMFTMYGGDEAYHYRRRHGRWTRSRLTFPQGAPEFLPSVALSPDGATLVLTTLDTRARVQSGRGEPKDDAAGLAIFRRGADGSFAFARAARLPRESSGVAFVGGDLLVGSLSPDPQGDGLWRIDLASGRPRTRIAIPLEQNGTVVHGLDAGGDFAAIAQLDALWAVDLRADVVLCRLRLPGRRDGRSARPRAAVFGTRIVAAVDNRVGLYDLTPPP